MKFFLIFLLSLITGCQSPFHRQAASELDSPIGPYETVNSVPQFAAGEDHFLFYWAIWRGIAEAEKAALNGGEGALLSMRDISWQMQDCSSGALIHSDKERVWYFDDLRFNPQGEIIPIKEANRLGYRYINMMNINSQHLRGAGPFKAPKKNRGEKMEDWDKRRHAAFLEWLHKSWAKNSRGSIWLNAQHKLFSKQHLTEKDPWIEPRDYPKLSGNLLEMITKLSSSRWPIHFDERAHKPHLFEEPKSWTNPQVISKNQFRMRLDWNWCDPSQQVKVELFVPRGEMPPPGPNRPGRTDSGKNSIKVTEIDWPN
ncbi:MAG: hypothetical protein ACKN9V_09440 [Pseudomonadota bacterium]